MGRRRYVLIGLGVLGGIAATALIGVVGFGVFLRTDAGERWIIDRIEGALSSDEMTAEIGSIETDLWTGARIEDFRLESEGMIIDLGRVDADIDRNALLGGELRLKRARVDGALIDLAQSDADPDEPVEPFSGIGIDLAIDRVELYGANVIYRATDGSEIVRITGASGSASFVAEGPELRVDDLDLHALVGLQGSVATRVESGGVTIDAAGTHLRDIDASLPSTDLTIDGSITDSYGLDIDVDRLRGQDVDQLLGGVGLAGDLSGTVGLSGPLDRLEWSADLKGVGETQGRATASGTVDLTTETLGWTVDADLEDLDVHQVYPGVGESMVLSGRAVVDGKGTAYPDDMTIDVTWTGRSHDAFGQHIDGAEAAVHIEDGVVTLEKTEIDGILGELNLTGTVATVDGPLALRATGRIQPHRLRELGVSGIDSSGWLDARISGDLSDSDAPIRVVGSVRFAPFRSGDSIRFETALATFDILAQGGNVDGTASVTAETGDVGGIGIAEAEVPEIHIHRTPAEMNVSGDLIAREIAMPDTLWTRSASGTWTVTDAGADADIALGPLEVMGIAGIGGRIGVQQRGDSVGLDVLLNAGDRELLRTRGTFDTARSAMALDSLEVRPTVEGELHTTRALKLTLTDGGMTDADIALDGSLGKVEVTGTLGTKGPLDGRVILRGLELQRVGEIDPEALPGLAGTVDLDVGLSGDASAALLTGSVKAAQVGYSDSLAGLELAGTFETTEGSLTTDLTIGVQDSPIATVTGSLPTALDLADPKLDPRGLADLKIALLPGDFQRFADLSPSAGEGLLPGRVSGVLEVDGSLLDPEVRLAGVTEITVAGWADPQRTEFEFLRQDGMVNGWADLRTGHLNFAMISASGRTDMTDMMRQTLADNAIPEDFDWTSLAEDLFVYAAVLNVPVDMLAQIADVDVNVAGELTGGFQVTGTPAKPRLDGGITWEDGRIGRQSVEDLFVGFTPADAPGVYALDMRMDFGDEAGLYAKGTIPLDVDLTVDSAEWATEPMAIEVGGGGVPIRALAAFTRGIGKVDGKLTIDGNIRGTAFKPEARMNLGMQDVSMNVNPAGVRVEKLSMEASVSPTSIDLISLTGESRPIEAQVGLQEAIGVAEKAFEELETERTLDWAEGMQNAFFVDGRVGLDGGTPTDVSIKVQFEHDPWLFATNDTQVQLMRGGLNVKGVYPDLRVGNKVPLTLKHGLVKLDAATFTDRTPLEVDPRISIHGRTGRVEEEVEEPPWYNNVVVEDLALKLNRSLELDVAMPFVDDLGSIGAFVSTADLNARIGGQTSLDMRDGVATMEGELEVATGRLKMLGRRFDVREGRITFTGADISEPRLDIAAGGSVGGVQVGVNVSGTPSSPGITPECDGYPSEADCLMILISGRPPDASGESNTAAALAGMALGSLLGEQNVADFSFDPDGSIEISATLTSGVYLTYTRTAQPDLGENANTIEVDVGLPKRMVWNIGAGDQQSWTDLFLEIRF